MYKIPAPPTAYAKLAEIADYAEVECLIRGRKSKMEIASDLDLTIENDLNDGCEDEESVLDGTLDEVMQELDVRSKACGDGYPFEIRNPGTTIYLKDAAIDNTKSLIYICLLLSTRLNMNTQNRHANEDATKILEELAACVIKNYLGSDRVISYVFGTGASGGFEEKVNEMCRLTGEGGQFRSSTSKKTNAKDAKVDTVAWIPFSDKLPGQLMILGQCKTGDNWRSKISELRPDVFSKLWLDTDFFVLPVRAFFVAESVDRTRWPEECIPAGVLFDRCRLVDYCEHVTADIEDKIKKWTVAAQVFIKELLVT